MLLPEHPRFLSVHPSACPLLSSHRVRHGLDPVAPGLDAVHRPGRGARGRLGHEPLAPRRQPGVAHPGVARQAQSRVQARSVSLSVLSAGYAVVPGPVLGGCDKRLGIRSGARAPHPASRPSLSVPEARRRTYINIVDPGMTGWELFLRPTALWTVPP